MQIALHAGPSAAAWAWANLVVSESLANGWRIADSDAADTTLQGRPDWLLSSNDAKSSGSLDVIVFAPDFVAADLGARIGAQLVEEFAGRALPAPGETRWFASAFVNASKLMARHTRMHWVGPDTSVIDIDGLGGVQRPTAAVEARAPDPALGIYKPDVAIGERAFWGAVLFAPGLDHAGAESKWTDLTGRVAPIAFDPGMSLVAGRWSIEWFVEVDAEHGAVELAFQWSANQFSRLINRPGLYSVVQVGDLLESGHVAASITSARPHFHGKARLSGALITYLGPPSERVSED